MDLLDYCYGVSCTYQGQVFTRGHKRIYDFTYYSGENNERYFIVQRIKLTTFLNIGVFTLFLSQHDRKGMVNFDLAQLRPPVCPKPEVTNLAMVSGVEESMVHNKQLNSRWWNRKCAGQPVVLYHNWFFFFFFFFFLIFLFI